MKIIDNLQKKKRKKRKLKILKNQWMNDENING